MGWQGCIPSGVLKDNLFSWLSFPRGHLHSLSHGLSLQLQNQQHSIFSLLWPPNFLCKDPSDYIWPTKDYLQIFNLIASAKYLLPCKITYLQVWGVDLYTSLRGHYSAHHRREGSRTGQREKLNCDVDGTETSDNPMESLNQACSSEMYQIEARVQAFVLPKLSCQWIVLPQRGNKN